MSPLTTDIQLRLARLSTDLLLLQRAVQELMHACAQHTPRMSDGDLLAALAAAAGGSLDGVTLGRVAGAAATVVLVAGDYPTDGDRGTPIEGIPDAEAAGSIVFHAGTALHEGRLVTNGGRLLGVTATGATLAAARDRAYAAADLVRIPGARRREDIALASAGSAVEVGGGR